MTTRRLKFAPKISIQFSNNRTPSGEIGSPLHPITPIYFYPSFPNFSATPLLKGKIWIGTYEDAKNLPSTISRVLNVAQECEPIEKKDIKIKWIKLYDHSDQSIVECFNDAFQFIHEGVMNDEPVFVHCMKGVSRSVALVIAYLMAFHTQSIVDVKIDSESTSTPLFQKAFGYVKARREFVSPNFGFCTSLNMFSMSFGNDFVLR